MQKITEQQIMAMAPNATAAANGRKISQKGGFVRRERSEDDTFYLGECTGSGKSNYITTVDFLDPSAPVVRCSCPSRQFPCKHGLALLFEIAGQKSFGQCEIPEDILKKRERKQARAEKASEAASLAAGEGVSDSEAQIKAAARRKTSKAAQTRKRKKQLEGLGLAGQLVQDLMKTGLGAMGGAVLSEYKSLSKQLGDYYLPGPQRLLNGLILEIEAFQKDHDESHYEAAADRLEKLWTLVKKASQYLNDKLSQGEEARDDGLLYEELGGVWKLSDLEELGRSRRAELIQLAFWISYDEARKEYIDTGCWADLETGEVSLTYNYRPLKALKYVKEEDSFFGVAETDSACSYPGEGNLRIRWDKASLRDVTREDIEKVRGFGARAVVPEAKAAKNVLKNTLASPVFFRLIAYEQIGKAGEDIVLRSEGGDTILLGDWPEGENTLRWLSLLPDPALLTHQVLLGGFYYDRQDRRLKLWPVSIVAQDRIVRLLF
ncbi:MAG: SWIM zinc finger family protein [Lachnospiraceae bacterium]|jgi:hypothetical protein|nr:SWIM zinc finger family protein [Lachnospiraceae bacterium]